ncbi:MAG: LacI family transcriptional regulator [Lachnospiraceae bacterium]|nr:LacI family transcriptional regulator [Lachnospiraceae bacterium]
MTTIRDVAKHAGVAVSTVSKVINHYPNVSEETVERVRQAIDELGFVPNSVAAALSSKQSGRIAILLNPSIQTQAIDEITMQYLTGAMLSAQELRTELVPILFGSLEGKDETEAERYLEAQNIKGLVVCGMSKEDYVLQRLVAREHFKCALVDVPIVNDSTSYIGLDHKQAQKDIARKTIMENLGPSKEILYISGKMNGFVSEQRLAGMLELAEELDLSMSVHCGEFSEKKAREITLKYGAGYDIIVCASDLMAIGAMKALIEMDIFHPVCGFDGITLMGYVGKQMNTVRQNFREIGAEAVRECARLMGGEKGQSVIMDHELVRLEYLDIIV